MLFSHVVLLHVIDFLSFVLFLPLSFVACCCLMLLCRMFLFLLFHAASVVSCRYCVMSLLFQVGCYFMLLLHVVPSVNVVPYWHIAAIILCVSAPFCEIISIQAWGVDTRFTHSCR